MKAPPGGEIWSRTFGEILAPFYHQERVYAFKPLPWSIACNDGTIGLYQMGARWYDPALGRFISADTIIPNPLNPQDFNRYSYASNNPLRYRDPTGHINWDAVRDAVDKFFMGVVYQIGANNYEALGVTSESPIRTGMERVAQEHSDSMAFEAGRLVGSIGTAIQGVAEVGGGAVIAEGGLAMSGTGVGALAGVPVAGAGLVVVAHGSLVGVQSASQAGLSAGRLIKMASGKGGGSGGSSSGSRRDFASEELRQRHFNKHKGEFGVATEQEYLDLANEFFDQPVGGDILELTRSNGDIVRFNQATNEFAVLRNDGTIRTYFKLDPAIHGYPTNLDYFYAQQ